MSTEPRKEAIIEALYRFINQRPGLEFGNYGDRASYSAEVRSIGKDLKQSRELLRCVARHSSLTADDLIAAAKSAWSGRLEFDINLLNCNPPRGRIDYCTGQYWPTEYRRAVCAVLAAALWSYVREHCMPAPSSHVVEWNSRWDGRSFVCDSSHNVGIHEACRIAREHKDAAIVDYYKCYWKDGKQMRAGDWLRAYFRREFGRGMQARWFN